MRLIVACPECKRQYDASGRKPGDRFRCHCGEQLTVRQPRAHQASVVRCSSCGAPREGQQTECAHCGADFTIHERDLDTVCPNCLARVSNRARYCHHCAAVLTGEKVAGRQTSYHCPVCGPDRTLVDRRLSDQQMSVLECGKCGGFWLGLETFELLLEAEARQPKPSASSSRRLPIAPQQGPAYRPCVVCGGLMVRRNFGRGKSGVIVDICGSHGIWFDADELSRLMAWIRSGGLEAARVDVARLRESTDKVRKRQALREETKDAPYRRRTVGSLMYADGGADEDPFAEIGLAAAQLLGRMFRRF